MAAHLTERYKSSDLDPIVGQQISQAHISYRRQRPARHRAPDPDPCTCWVDEKYWFVWMGHTEPGSTKEYDPECPEHGTNMPQFPPKEES